MGHIAGNVHKMNAKYETRVGNGEPCLHGTAVALRRASICAQLLTHAPHVSK